MSASCLRAAETIAGASPSTSRTRRGSICGRTARTSTPARPRRSPVRYPWPQARPQSGFAASRWWSCLGRRGRRASWRRGWRWPARARAAPAW